MTKISPPDPPSDPTQVQPEWLEWHLTENGLISGVKVTSVHCEPMGGSVGFLSRMAKLVPQYSEPVPENLHSLILKMGTTRPHFQEVADRLHVFDREVGFYKHIAPTVTTRLAKLYASDPAGGSGWMLLEDLCFLEKGDQIHGLSNAQVSMTLQRMGEIHAANWRQSSLNNFDWLPEDSFWFKEELSNGWDEFRKHYELRLSGAAIAMMEQVLDKRKQLDDAIAMRPRTLVHGDLRADNLLLGKPGSKDEVLILDWQTATRSMGAIDVALLIGGSDPPAERSGHYDELFDGWYETLLAQGVTNYHRQEAINDLRLGMLSALRIPIKVFRDFGGPNFRNAREAQLADVLTFRHVNAAIDFDAIQALS